MRSRFAALVLHLSALALLPTVASADWYIGGGIGPLIQADDWPNQFRVEEEIGYFFEGNEGFFVAVMPGQSWGNDFWHLAFPVGGGYLFPAFSNESFHFQIGPVGQAGFAASESFKDGAGVDPWFYFGASLTMRFLLIGEPLAFYIRPVGLEFGAGDSGRGHGRFDGRYYFSGGVHYAF